MSSTSAPSQSSPHPARALRLALAATLAAALALSGPAARAAPGASLTVTTTADEHDLTGAGTGCALREAIVAANTDSAFGGCPAGSGADLILLPSGAYTLTRPGPGEDLSATGDLDLRSALTLSSTSPLGAVVDGSSLDRVFDISGTVPVELAGLTITGGHVAGSLGAGIYNRASALTLTHTSVISNVSVVAVGGIAHFGGALVIVHGEIRGNRLGGLHTTPGSSLRLVDTLVRDNAAGLTLAGNVVIQSSQILSQTATDGLTFAGLVSDTARIEDSLISFNHGGLANGGAGLVTVVGSTLSHNTTAGLRSSAAPARTVVVNSTLSGNLAAGVDAATGALELFNVTIAGNGGGGLVVAGSAIVTLHNSLLAGNAPDCAGALVSGGYNLIASGSGCTLTGTLTGNLLDTPAGLAPLGTNGGPTPTHALVAGSAAIDAGDPAGCADGLGGRLDRDQRGFDRPGRCDIGAYEYAAVPPVRYFVPFLSRP